MKQHVRRDPLVDIIHATQDLLTQHGVSFIANETDGGHVWANWRNYLHDFAPRLFK